MTVRHVSPRVEEREHPEHGGRGPEERAHRVDAEIQPDVRRELHQEGLVLGAARHPGGQDDRDGGNGERYRGQHQIAGTAGGTLERNGGHSPEKREQEGQQRQYRAGRFGRHVNHPYIRKTKVTAAFASSNGIPGTDTVVPRKMTHAAHASVGPSMVQCGSRIVTGPEGAFLKKAR